MKPIIPSLLLAGALAGCYGTMPPPPLSSRLPPSGLGGVTVIDRPIPIDLTELLTVYRQSLLEQAHHLPAARAQRYVDDDIAMLKLRHAGDTELQAELTRRLQAQRRPAVPGRRPAAALYPPDLAAEPGKDAR